MAYENFQVCKELYLPMPSENMTLEEYKKTYGIDLKPFIYIDGNEEGATIFVEFPLRAKVYLVHSEGTNFRSNVSMPNDYVQVDYEFEDTDGYTNILCKTITEDSGFGIQFFLSKDQELSVENIIVKPIDY